MANWKNETNSRIEKIREANEKAIKTIDGIITHYDNLCSNVRTRINRYYQDELERGLSRIDIGEINQNKDGIRVNLLVNAGYDNIVKLRRATPDQLREISGIGEETVNRIKRNIAVMEEVVSKEIFLRFDADKRDAFHSQLLFELFIMRYGAGIAARARDVRLQVNGAGYIDRLNQISKEPGILSRFFWSTGRIAEYRDKIENINIEIQDGIISPAVELDQAYLKLNNDARACWDDFLGNAVSYYSMVEKLWPVNFKDRQSESGELSEAQKLMRKIDDSELDLSLMRSDLRNYQLFGTKYMISQGKVLIGDEMGLGKTIQAIAAMAHLKAKGGSVFVVVCPLSILANWDREIQKHSSMQAVVIHGPAGERERQFLEWKDTGKIAITTYDALGKLLFHELEHIDMLVVDEAHNVKNPNAQRTAYVRRLIGISSYVVYMTGTPLENKVEEMRFLIRSLNDEVGLSIAKVGMGFSSDIFKEKIAPVYLRRVREDVLKELPELIEIEDWLLLNDIEEQQYEKTLIERNYMNVRRLSWNVPLESSTKAQKLAEICEEAAGDNRKVLVFSFFIKTIESVAKLVGNMCVGMITGATPADERQRFVDIFTAAPAGSVLVCQVNTGGTGLNIQAASVVVFCEPQWKPSTEDQALSRSYRMGQARSVMVHRLLATDSIDERMMQTLQRKKGIFNEYAEESAIGNANQKLSEEKEMMAYIEEEIRKRGLQQESYPWSKFYPDHCNDRNVDEMREENISLVADTVVADLDLADALGELRTQENRCKIFDDLHASGYEVTEQFIKEYFEAEGNDMLLGKALSAYTGIFSAESVMEFVIAGVEDDIYKLIMSRCDGRFSFSQIVDIVEFVGNVEPQVFQKIMENAVGVPTYDQLDEILSCVDAERYEYIKPYVKKLPFDQRVELRDTYDI